MANMSYCRFENTYADLYDCYENLFDDELSDDEERYKRKLIRTCVFILESLGYTVEDPKE